MTNPNADTKVLEYAAPTVYLARRFIQHRLPRAHKVLRKLYRLPYDYWKPKPGDISKLLEHFCSNLEHPPLFVQIGANNGVDEFTDLRRRYRWKGIMVEPQKDIFNELLRLNTDDGLTFEPVAINDRECELPLYKISFSRADWAHTLASFDRKIIEQSIEDGWISRCAAAEGITPPESVDEWISVETVRCITLQKLLDKYEVTDFDLLILDTEGHDCEIIKQVGWLRYKPRTIVFEHKFFSTPDLKACIRSLRKWGYKMNSDDSNIIGVRTLRER